MLFLVDLRSIGSACRTEQYATKKIQTLNPINRIVALSTYIECQILVKFLLTNKYKKCLSFFMLLTEVLYVDLHKQGIHIS